MACKGKEIGIGKDYNLCSKMDKNCRYSIGESLKKITLSTLVISGTAWALWGGFHYFLWTRSHDLHYQLKALIQTGEEKEALPTYFLAELIGVSKEVPVNLYELNLRRMEEKLKSFPLIASATLTRSLPSSLSIDYQIRKPVAFYGDLSNTAIDSKKVLIPFSPFFTPKNLPTLYLGVGPLWKWGHKLDHVRAELGFRLLDRLKSELKDSGFDIKVVDVTRCELESRGACQIVVHLSRPIEGSQVWLILDPLHYNEGLSRFKAIVENCPDLIEINKGYVVDLRLDNLAYLTKK